MLLNFVILKGHEMKTLSCVGILVINTDSQLSMQLLLVEMDEVFGHKVASVSGQHDVN